MLTLENLSVSYGAIEALTDGTQGHVAAFPGYESTRQLVLCRAFASQAAA